METEISGGDLRLLSNQELLDRTQQLAEKERRISLSILHHLAEIDRRRAYARAGFPSLWDYALKELKYSESAAYRRISAMRALKSHPELEEKIQSGALSVTTVSQVQTFLKAEREQANRSYTPGEKAAIFQQCENKSSREVTRELLNYSPLACRVQKERAISENRTVISFVAENGLVQKIHRVRDLSVARLRNPGSYPELVDFMSEITLDEIDPLRKKAVGLKPDQTVALIAPQPTQMVGQTQAQAQRQTRYIPAALRAQIWKEFGGRCAYVNPETGKRCDSTFGLEIEHCKPYSLGGSSKDPRNLRLLCRHHNQLQAIEALGLAKMEPYLKPKNEN